MNTLIINDPCCINDKWCEYITLLAKKTTDENRTSTNECRILPVGPYITVYDSNWLPFQDCHQHSVIAAHLLSLPHENKNSPVLEYNPFFSATQIVTIICQLLRSSKQAIYAMCVYPISVISRVIIACIPIIGLHAQNVYKPWGQWSGSLDNYMSVTFLYRLHSYFYSRFPRQFKVQKQGSTSCFTLYVWLNTKPTFRVSPLNYCPALETIGSSRVPTQGWRSPAETSQSCLFERTSSAVNGDGSVCLCQVQLVHNPRNVPSLWSPFCIPGPLRYVRISPSPTLCQPVHCLV